MKKVSGRALFLLLLTLVLAAGTLAFCLSYAIHAEAWATFPGSPYVYNGTSLRDCTVYDRTGAVLLDTAGERCYAPDASVRAATMHLLGDRYGYIPSPLIEHYADTMAGYSAVEGFSSGHKQAQARLTISETAQAAALQALGTYKGTVGVYNYKTGEILCAVTSPSYDPDDMPDVAGDETGQYDGVYVNRFFDAAYTPGSVFKLLTAAAALEEDAAAASRSFTCRGAAVIGGQQIVCMGTHGEENLSYALAHSCNVAFGELAADLGAQTLQGYVNKLGLNGTLRLDGFSCRSTVDLSGADEGSVAWAGIGQYTDQVTACQFLRFMGVLAGGGEAAEPYLMQRVRRGEAVVYEAEPVSTGRLLQAQTASALAGMMRSAVQTVYGDWLFGGLSVCAKSGTAEHENRRADAMFAGFVQDEACPLAFVVFVEEGGSGSQTAAPIAAQVLAACRQVLDAQNSAA